MKKIAPSSVTQTYTSSKWGYQKPFFWEPKNSTESSPF